MCPRCGVAAGFAALYPPYVTAHLSQALIMTALVITELG
jgi:hypothetical protein